MAIKPRMSVVPIFQGDDLDPIAEHRLNVERAIRTSEARRVGDSIPFSEAVAAYDAFMDGAVERAEKVTLAALRKGDWRELVAAHPPREDVLDEAGEVVEAFDQDAAVGFNVDSIAESLLAATFERVEQLIRDGVIETPQEFDVADLDELSDADYSRVVSRAIDLNTGAGPDPKARLSLLLDRTSSETSESPGRLG